MGGSGGGWGKGEWGCGYITVYSLQKTRQHHCFRVFGSKPVRTCSIAKHTGIPSPPQ